MAYEVSEKIRKAVMNVTEDAKVRKGFDFIEEDNDYIIDKQIELTLIPAPTFNEGKKAQRLLEIFREEGLSDCHIDDYGNVVGIRKGTGGGKIIGIPVYFQHFLCQRGFPGVGRAGDQNNHR